MYLGVYGGANLVLGDWDLNEDSDGGVSPRHSPLVALRLGVQFNPWIALELGGALVPFSADAPGDLSATALSLRGDLLVSLVEGNWSPHLLVGGGLYQLASGDLGEDADWHVHWGLGLRGMLTGFMNLRVEARHLLTDSFGTGLASNVELQLGLDFWLWSASARPADSDGDGLADPDDACPTIAGEASARGCPDADRDGVARRRGPVPRRAWPRGPPWLPRQRQRRRRRPRRPVPRRARARLTRRLPATASRRGRRRDPRPRRPVPRRARPSPRQGLPRRRRRRDHRSVSTAAPTSRASPRRRAACRRPSRRSSPARSAASTSRRPRPRSAGTPSRSSTRRPSSFRSNPTLRVEISGHTDDQGPDAMNLELSQQRADSVKAYLVERGVAAERLTAIGYGETRPVATNKTNAGRAQNRRIEFKILGQN